MEEPPTPLLGPGAVSTASALLRWPIATSSRLVWMTLPTASSAFAGFRFPPEVITVAVRWYLRYGRLSYREVEVLLAERRITVAHVTVYRWVQRFTSEFIEAARPAVCPGDRWCVDET